MLVSHANKLRQPELKGHMLILNKSLEDSQASHAKERLVTVNCPFKAATRVERIRFISVTLSPTLNSNVFPELFEVLNLYLLINMC